MSEDKIIFKYNTRVIEGAEFKDDWLVLKFKDPHPIKSEVKDNDKS